MAVPVLRQAFVTGEISPEIFGRVDLDREQVGATTARSMFVNYRGGLNSRAGTSFCGFSKQTGRQFPPRLMAFQFSINQGLILEFGNFYMRVLFDGAFVTENPLSIGGVTQADPAVVTFGSQGAVSATINNGGVTFPYAPGDLVSLAGGTALTEAVLSVSSSTLLSLLVNVPGTSYAIGDTINLAGGTSAPNAVATVATLQSVKAKGSFNFTVNPSDTNTIVLDGTTWTFKTVTTTATETAIQPTLAQTLAQLVIDLNASADANVSLATYATDGANLFITYKVAGTGGNSYTTVSGGAWAVASGGTLTGGSATGVGTVTISTPGIFSALPAGYLMTQSGTSGGGSGASFQTALFGPFAVAVAQPGAYSVVPGNPVAQDTSTGIGQGVTFNVTWGAVAAFNNQDWIFVAGVGGMTELNGNTYVVAGAGPSTIELFDVYGDAVDSSAFAAYTGGGTAARIYTVPTIYAEVDLPYLKITQSADVMTICCVNQETGTEYPPQNLSRLSDTDWVFSPVVAETSVNPPASAAVVLSTIGGGITNYAYVITAVSPVDGSESIASNIARTVGKDLGPTNVVQATISWAGVLGVDQYNIYKAQPSYNVPVPDGSLYGFLGSAYGTSFVDLGNVVQDYSQVPPLHRNPFARGQIAGVTLITPGSGYANGATATITSATGSGGSISVEVTAGVVTGLLILDAGSGYEAGDTITINPVSGGSGASATLTIGPETGTYPSVPAYFQQRRAYGNSLNLPDTYWMSQPGAFLNFDSRLPTIDADAITGSPWAVQVNGIQWMVQTSGGLLVMTGLSAWLLVGAGSFATNVQPISPANQDNVPQAFTGVSSLLPPVRINYDVIYANSKNSFYYDLPYQLYALSEPIDLTEISTHLFEGYTMLSNCWCEQPSKLFWAVRNDGIMLSLTFYKAQAVAGWTRHDTNGLFVSNASVVELPVDALYVATKRYPGGREAYMIERMDNRMWNTVEDAWAVDCGLALPMDTPSGTLTANSASGLGALIGVTGLVGGSGYSAGTTATVVDDNGEGPGTGAVVALTIIAGVITAVNFTSPGVGYTNPKLVVLDPVGPCGSGFAAVIILDTSATFTASSPVFGVGDVGSVIRMGGGVATITAFNSSSSVKATINTPIARTIPNSGGLVQPQAAGDWTLTAPVTTISGLDHLIGTAVTGLADGNVITPRVVRADGSIALDVPASAVVVGLGFTAQMQTTYLEFGQPTNQGQRKKVATADALLTNSRGVQMGSNQVDGSTLSPPQIDPPWTVNDVPDLAAPAYNSKTAPLYTGWTLGIPVQGGFTKTGQVCLQQSLPLPLNVDAIVPSFLAGDSPSAQWPEPGGRGQQQ